MTHVTDLRDRHINPERLSPVQIIKSLDHPRAEAERVEADRGDADRGGNSYTRIVMDTAGEASEVQRGQAEDHIAAATVERKEAFAAHVDCDAVNDDFDSAGVLLLDATQTTNEQAQTCLRVSWADNEPADADFWSSDKIPGFELTRAVNPSSSAAEFEKRTAELPAKLLVHDKSTTGEVHGVSTSTEEQKQRDAVQMTAIEAIDATISGVHVSLCYTLCYTLCHTLCYTLYHTLRHTSLSHALSHLSVTLLCHTLCHTLCYTLCYSLCYTLCHTLCYTLCYTLYCG